MPSGDLYDILHISPNATQEEVRKAYKKRALQTHPDRLPPNATAADKAASEEQFRKVNNAYEVLNDPQNRKIYDLNGVWPPPTEQEVPRRPAPRYRSARPYNTRPDPFSDPFFGRGYASFHFTDPFVLFDSIFNDHPHRAWRHSYQRRPTVWQEEDDEDPFASAHHMHSNINNLMANMEHNMFSGFGGAAFPPVRSHLPMFPAVILDSGPSSSGGGRWASESTMSQTINGVTHTIRKRRDWDGNEHVTRVYPDGRKVVTLNGVEQHDQSYLPPPHSAGAPPDPRHMPPPPVIDPAFANTHHQRLPPPPPYSSVGMGGSTSSFDSDYARRRAVSDFHRQGPVVPDMFHEQVEPEHKNKRRWWGRG